MGKSRKLTTFVEMKKQITIIKEDESLLLFYRIKKSRSQDQLLYANSVQPATTPGFQPAEKTSFVSTNAISER